MLYFIWPVHWPELLWAWQEGIRGRSEHVSRVTETGEQPSVSFSGPIGSFYVLQSLGKLSEDKCTGSQPKS